MTDLTFGSLFAGIGGMDLGLERAGWRCRWQVEIDDYCRRVLAKHWPDVPKYGDIREVTGGELERVDLICGGFPCQDISNAGKRAGIDGERSGLWSEYIRLVRVLRPRYVLVENVAALLGRGIDRVLGDLATCGYDAEWDCIPAASVGAPHLRDRLFIIAHAASEQQQGHPRRVLRESARATSATGREDLRLAHRTTGAVLTRPDGQTLADAPRRGCDEGSGLPPAVTGADAAGCGADVAEPERQGLALGLGASGERTFAPITGSRRWATEPDVGRVAHGVPARVDRLRGLGNAVVPQVAEWIGRRILEAI